MLLGAESLAGEFNLQKLWFPGVLALILAVETAYLLVTKARPVGDILPPEAVANDPRTLVELSKALFSNYLLPFEVTSILLLVAMVGAIVLTHKEKRAPK